MKFEKYLSGKVLQEFENLGHSAEAYEVAKSRLERKYGEHRRQVNLCMEVLDQM